MRIKVSCILERKTGEPFSRVDLDRQSTDNAEKIITELLRLWAVACERATIHDCHATLRLSTEAREIWLISPANHDERERERFARLFARITNND